jgi:hypothetical protein
MGFERSLLALAHNITGPLSGFWTTRLAMRSRKGEQLAEERQEGSAWE